MQQRRTEDLIEALATEGARAATLRPPGIALAALVGAVPSAVVFLAVFGPHRDFWSFASAPGFLLRASTLAMLAWASLSLIPQLGRPGARINWSRLVWPLLILLASLLAEGAGWITAPVLPRAPSAWLCIGGILGLAASPVIALLRALRARAATDAAAAGAIAGLAGGAIGAMLYALWCDGTAPSFFLQWYGASLMLCAGAGALAGRYTLRW